MILSHDGNVDDIVCVCMCLGDPKVELIGVCITEADCYLSDAYEATKKVLRYAGREDIPVACCASAGVNPFPPQFREYSAFPNMLPALNEDGGKYTPPPPGPEASSAPRPFTRCPC